MLLIHTMNLTPRLKRKITDAHKLGVPVSRIALQTGVSYMRCYRYLNPPRTPRCVTGANQGARVTVPVPPQSSDEANT